MFYVLCSTNGDSAVQRYGKIHWCPGPATLRRCRAATMMQSGLVPGCLAPARPGADYELRNSSSRPACNEWGRGTGTAAPGPTRCTYVE